MHFVAPRGARERPEANPTIRTDTDDDDDDDRWQDGSDPEEESATLNAADQITRTYSPSTSPSRFDGADLLQDLSEMSTCADRIDQLLGEGSRAGSRVRSLSPRPMIEDGEEETEELD